MNTRRRLALLVVMTGFILTASGLPPALSQEKPGNPAYDWLNGKWYGRAPGGGELELQLRVLNGNEITGHSRIPRAGAKRDVTKSISGSVDGDKVRLELYRGEVLDRYLTTDESKENCCS
jgi:hypothetical protein